MINYLKNITLLIIAGVVALGLNACATDNAFSSMKLQPTAPKDNAQKQKLYRYLLAEKGIDIMSIGETRTIVIATDPLFIGNSANLNNQYAYNLKIVARLINSYDTTSVAVTAYTDKSGDVSRALTEKQAQKIVVYLKKNGVDTRLIYAKGYGNLYPVSIGKNTALNRRIEIKFQFHPTGGIE